MTINGLSTLSFLASLPANNGEATRQIDGFSINTTGHAQVDPQYRQILEQQKQMLAQGGVPLQPLSMDTSTFLAAKAEGRDGSAYVTQQLSAQAIHFGQEAQPDLRSVSGIDGYIPGSIFQAHNAGAVTSYQRGQLTELMEMMGVEKRLKQEFGDDIKLAYDNRAGDYVMLRPGDVGYDSVMNTQQALAATQDYFNKGFADKNDFADIFQRYGIG